MTWKIWFVTVDEHFSTILFIINFLGCITFCKSKGIDFYKGQSFVMCTESKIYFFILSFMYDYLK